ncbi:hypothetical protein IFM89_021651 [Coptis chinensis]|uniref:Exportin-T n=1 Tax=Coptis chinensis TaxID=261450 RepID=A0A835IA02_9MAGN|nr:hypothetical protein IFM89_021651 [Coptis chinensis]
MDDFEKAILISFDESGTIDPILKSQAVSYCQQTKETPDVHRICIERLSYAKFVQVQFWCLQTLHDVIRLRYTSISVDEKAFIRKTVMAMACYEYVFDENSGVRVLDGPAFIKNKFAQEVAVACRVKDSMRQQCIAQIVRAWFDIVSFSRNSDTEICTSVLDCMRRYVSWIDIGLIANDAFVPLLFELILVEGPPEQLRVTGDRDSELVSKVAALLTGYASEVLDCSKRLDTEEIKGMSVELLDEILPSVFYVMQNCEMDTAFSVVQFLSSYVATMKSLSPLKEKQVLHVGQILEVIRVQICYDPVYRDNLDVPDKIGKEEEDRMVEFRKDLFVLLRSVGRVASDVTQLFIKNSLASAAVSSSERNVEEVEAALSLFYALGESMSDEGIRTGSGLLRELVPTLLSTRFPCHSNRLVALVYMETITRYVKFVQENTDYIPYLLTAFLDERGIHHSNVNVSRRASYLFMRVVKMLKAKLVPFIETVLQQLQDTVTQLTSLDFASRELKASGSEDGSHIFEAIGLLIGMEEVSPEKQSEYLKSLLTPLCQQVEVLLIDAKAQNGEGPFAKIANIQQIIMAINALSKGFSERPRSQLADLELVKCSSRLTMDILLEILVVFPKIEPLRSKVTSFIHRMVDTLGASVFPYLPKALEQLLAESEPKEMVAFLVLINQLICKFSALVSGILEEIFPVIASRIFHVLPRNGIPSEPGGNTEEIRELQELQKTLYTLLHVMTTHDLSSVFITPKSIVYLEPITQLLLYTSCSHKDILLRKTCVQLFIRLIKDWCTRSQGEEKVPGFQKFIVETFATNCCFYSVIDKSFDLRDANTLILFGEIVVAQKVMYEKFGNVFLVHFVSKGLKNAQCPQDLVEEYYQKLQGSDIKALKSFYQSLIERLRCQQNGSFVFR